MPNTHPRDPVLKTCAMNNTFFQLIQNKNLFLAVPRKINFSDILYFVPLALLATARKLARLL